MLKTLFEGMLATMQKYVDAKAACAKELAKIDQLLEYSEWKKDELRAEQREKFRAKKQQLIDEFSDQVNKVKAEMQERQTKIDLNSPALTNALLFINGLTEDGTSSLASGFNLALMKRIAINFAGDPNSLNMLLCTAECRKLHRGYLDAIKKMLYSDEKMDELRDRFTKAVDGNLMIRYAAKETMSVAYTCGVILNDPEICDAAEEDDFIKAAMGLPVSSPDVHGKSVSVKKGDGMPDSSDVAGSDFVRKIMGLSASTN